MVLHICNLSIREAEAGGSWTEGRPDLHSELKRSLELEEGHILKKYILMPPRPPH